MKELIKNSKYQQLIEKIGVSYQASKKKAISAVNAEMLKAYWNIGKYIIDFEQEGKIKAKYGKSLLINLSKDLSLRYGRGFSTL
ncbi:MAG: DUF1016 N-terminal domain-containing protein [Chitinophagales bacterium]